MAPTMAAPVGLGAAAEAEEAEAAGAELDGRALEEAALNIRVSW